MALHHLDRGRDVLRSQERRAGSQGRRGRWTDAVAGQGTRGSSLTDGSVMASTQCPSTRYSLFSTTRPTGDSNASWAARATLRMGGRTCTCSHTGCLASDVTLEPSRGAVETTSAPAFPDAGRDDSTTMGGSVAEGPGSTCCPAAGHESWRR